MNFFSILGLNGYSPNSLGPSVWVVGLVDDVAALAPGSIHWALLIPPQHLQLELEGRCLGRVSATTLALFRLITLAKLGMVR